MARRKGTLGEGARLADYLTVGYLALNCPLDRVHEVLAECGTHTLIGAHCAPYGTGEHTLAQHVLSAVDGTMWLLADRGFVGYCLWQRAEQTGAKLLFRVRHNQALPVHERLADGSYLSTLYENPKARRAKQGRPVRVIEYPLTQGGEVYRLITNELDPAQAPAQELAALYQRRWKVEMALGEVKTQLGGSLALRSKKPDLVIQEFYALLIAHAAIRKLMTEAAARSEAASEDLSFIHTVHVLKRRLPAQAALPP